jgi:LacI family transcriptional regulator
MAIGVMRELQRSGIRVPEDVAVTGFDNVFPGRLVEPPLTTVGQPVRDLGVRAAARLLERIEGATEPPRAETLPTELVLRRSCGCPPDDPPTVGQAGSAASRLRGGPGRGPGPKLAPWC